MMKTLLIMRHGKAEEGAPKGDKARVLVDRGEQEAALMGRVLKKMGLKPDAVVSSDAARAQRTAELAAEAAGYDGKIKLEPDIYAAGLDDLLEVVRKLPDDADRVLLVGHNPGFEDLSAALAKEGTDSPQLPTAAVALLEFGKAKKWKDVTEGSGKLVEVYRPRDYRG
jgi:phosphohistidine phosphatase